MWRSRKGRQDHLLPRHTSSRHLRARSWPWRHEAPLRPPKSTSRCGQPGTGLAVCSHRCLSVLLSLGKADRYRCVAEASPSPRCCERTYPVLPQTPGSATLARCKTPACKSRWHQHHRRWKPQRRLTVLPPEGPKCHHACTSPGPSLSSLGGSGVPRKSPSVTVWSLREKSLLSRIWKTFDFIRAAGLLAFCTAKTP